MKLSFAFVASLFLAAHAANISTEAAGVRTSLVYLPPSSDKHSSYHPTRADHVYTTNKSELTILYAFGFMEASTVGYIFPTEEVSTVALFRLVHPLLKDHLYTTEMAEVIKALDNGYKKEGITGYIFDKQVCGSQPLFRLFNSSIVDHFYTANWVERNNAMDVLQYKEEPIAGYIIG
ncbi:hypothetical protein EYR38_003269 [Pleurotus pulmonarius]|nr:hypothetical protein EYR38_003269 [Pleurotus pulmonarius]